jgi:hypothetical protein
VDVPGACGLGCSCSCCYLLYVPSREGFDGPGNPGAHQAARSRRRGRQPLPARAPVHRTTCSETALPHRKVGSRHEMGKRIKRVHTLVCDAVDVRRRGPRR